MAEAVIGGFIAYLSLKRRARRDQLWEPDGSTQRLRQLATVRATLMTDRTRIKNRIQSLLASRLIRCPYATLFAQRSIAWQ